jgi:hypothetical protein
VDVKPRGTVDAIVSSTLLVLSSPGTGRILVQQGGVRYNTCQSLVLRGYCSLYGRCR